jgi:hypothetical protein
MPGLAKAKSKKKAQESFIGEILDMEQYSETLSTCLRSTR